MAHTKAGAAFTELVLEIFRLNGNLLAEGDRLAAPLGLTSARWQILGAIEAQELSVAQISRKVGVTRQNVQRIADALEKIGMLSFTPNPAHQRAKLVRLSAKGARIVQELGARQVRWANRIASVASDSEIRTLLETMKKLAARLGSERPRKPRSAAL
jgi:DNA-binding MarR family transcriptional regulator